MTGAAKSGHPGGSLSAVEIVVELFFNHMKIDPQNPKWAERDRFLLSKGHAAPVLRVADLELNTVDRTVRRAGRRVTLTAMEFRVLEYLAHRPRAVVSKAELLEHLYDYNWEKFSNVIEVYISGLRRKLENGAAHPLIHTLRGQGYILRD